MNNSEIKTKDINIEAAINCYKRLQKASREYRAKKTDEHWERSRIDFQKMKTERPEKYKEIRERRKAIYHNDPEKKQKTHEAYLRHKEKKAQAKIQAANN
jgi:hypothetical protein